MKKEIIEELQDEINNGKGCIVFDLGCYFPYSNGKDVLTFKFKLGEEELEPYKLNHRYPNHHYATISKKIGRKVSKIGYPYFLELNVTHTMLFVIEFGIKDETIKLIFPLEVTLTDDKPVCGLTLHLKFKDDNLDFIFYSYEKAKDGGWYQHKWTNHDIKEPEKRTITMSQPTPLENNTLIYSDVIIPFSQKLNELMII